MSGTLQTLLGSSDPLFEMTIARLEQASGSEGRDIRLLSEVSARVRENCSLLGLSPQDLMGRELYAALLVKVAESSARLMTKLGLTKESSSRDVQAALEGLVLQVTAGQPVLALKRSVAKKMLKAVPPRTLMKRLGYRSVDSFLKHETVDCLYATAGFVEDSHWADRHFAQFEHLSATDFEKREVQVLKLSERYVKNKDLLESLPDVMCSPLCGSVGLQPTVIDAEAVLTSTLLLLEAVRECDAFSNYMGRLQLHPDFRGRLVRVLHQSDVHVGEMTGVPVPFHALHRHERRLTDETTEEVRQTPETLLASFDEEFTFWVDQDFVGQIYPDGVVTFNLFDLARAYQQSLSYEQFQTPHFQRSLWHELLARYLMSEGLKRQVLGPDPLY